MYELHRAANKQPNEWIGENDEYSTSRAHNEQKGERFCGENERSGCLGSIRFAWIGSPVHAGGVPGGRGRRRRRQEG